MDLEVAVAEVAVEEDHEMGTRIEKAVMETKKMAMRRAKRERRRSGTFPSGPWKVMNSSTTMLNISKEVA